MDNNVSWIDQWDTVDKVFSFIGLILALISPAVDRFRRRVAKNRVGLWAHIIGFLFLPFLPFIVVGNFLFKILLIAVRFVITCLIVLFLFYLIFQSEPFEKDLEAVAGTALFLGIIFNFFGFILEWKKKQKDPDLDLDLNPYKFAIFRILGSGLGFILYCAIFFG